MNQIRRKMAAILVAVLVYSILGGSLYGVFAVETPVSLTVDKFENGTLYFHWSQPAGAKATVVAFHKPNADNTATLTTSDPILVGNAASISGLEADYIYDITVTVYAAVDVDNKPSGSPIGRGILFYLPSISFRSTAATQVYDTMLGGGQEIGGKPKLKLGWKVPMSYYDPDNAVYPDTDSDPANNVFIQANQANALKYMQDSLNKIYDDDREISTFNYRINVSTELNLLNSGSAQAALLIDQQISGTDDYKVKVSGTADTATVTAPDGQGFVGFELWGRADESSSVPAPSNINVLPDADMLPGTVYYMNIKPIFRNSAAANVSAVTVGNPSDQNGSLLLGENSYTSTPIRFQLTKDSANNIYVKIFKINQGSLDLPRLFYEVQVTDDPAIQGDWTVKKTMDDSYFSGASAVTVITGVNPNNEVFYKIVVKSDSPDDKLESPPMPYTLTVDTSRPPLPSGIAVVDRTLKTGLVTPPAGVQITVKSTDVTLSWDKPLNWSAIKSNLYFNFLLNTNQTETAADVPLYVDGTYWGSYPAKYRLVKYISAASDKIKEVGNRLTYTMNAFDLFKWEGDTAADSGDITGNGDYPTFLIPNTVYYLQMYTTTAADRGTTVADKMSDRSVITSFTTLNGVEIDVPLPMNFSSDANGKDTSVIPAVNYIDLKFDKVTNIDWNNYTSEFDETKYSYETYYDIYMNTRTDTPFTLIGSTEDLHGDIGFTGADDPQSTSIKAKISQFTKGSAISLFGYHLLPNTTYYFKARTRLAIVDKANPAVPVIKESIDTAILPVTTVVLAVNAPDDSLRKPLAPTDFDIALDNSQNQLLSGSSVTFTWKRQEDDVIYQLIRTAQKVSPADEINSYGSDQEYQSFLQEYDILSDGADNEAIYLDPAPGAGNATHPGKFTYDNTTKICTYTVDRRMFPNKLYYFSMKAVRVSTARVPLTPASNSVWVSIPVTTSLIETPASLEVVMNAELGFYWTDSTVGLTAEDYKIYAKGPSDVDYKLMTRSQATIVKDQDGETYYGRLTGLKLNSSYDIRVTKGANTPVCDKSGLKTRDGCHELEIKWMGKPVDHYSRYDIALMAEDGSEYTVLSASDLEQYIDKDGAILPYYTEETVMTTDSEALYYHARIKSAEVVLPGGMTTNQPLRSNVKYYIKVRAVSIDPTETDFIAYSKYIGPVNTRTEFNQDDYDNTDREEQQKAIFLDRMENLEKGYFWRIAINSNSASQILLKGDRVVDAIRNSSEDSFTIDMTAVSVNLNTDEIYVPFAVIKVMNSLNRSLVFRTSGAELLLRPTTLDVSGNEQIKAILGRQEVKDLYVKMVIRRSSSASTALPSSSLRVSDINELDMQALGLAISDSDLKQLFYDKLYNKDSGLVNEKLNLLQNTYVGSGTDAARLTDQLTQNLVEMIEKELSIYIDSTLQSVELNYTVRDITTFGAPASASLSFSSSKGVKLPYVLYDGASSWQKITAGTVQTNSTVRFNLLKTGKYVILTAQDNIGDVPAGYWAEGYITSLYSKYDLADVFQGNNNSFMPENFATCKEVVLLYETVTGKAAENAGLDIRQKNEELGLDEIISPNSLVKNVKRQETAAILLKLLSVKKGASMSSLKPGGRVYIADEAVISEEYFNSVLMIVDMEVMHLDGSGKFYPVNQMTRAEVVAAFARMLELTGD